MRPAFIYLDLGNVLFRFDRERAFRQMASVCGTDADAVREAVLTGDPSPSAPPASGAWPVGASLHEALERGAIDWSGFHAAFSIRTGTRSDPAALAEAASDMFTLAVDMLPVLAALERIGCPTGILSNTSAVHWEHLLRGGYAVLPGRFTHLVLSYEEGVMKPDPAIFAAATARAGVQPERIFFCDDLPEHVAAARTAGWDAELFTSAGSLVAQLARRGINLGL
jgi:FMN phosphatase YigB (HAD superfamily)